MPAKLKSLSIMLCVQFLMWMFILTMAKVGGNPIEIFSPLWWVSVIVVGICSTAFEVEAYKYYSKPK